GTDTGLSCEARAEPTVWAGRVTYLGPVETGPIRAGQPIRLRYLLRGASTRGDRVLVHVVEGRPLANQALWGTTVSNRDGSSPFDFSLGTESSSTEILVRVEPPSTEGSETFIAVWATPCASRSNSIASTIQRLRVGEPPALGEREVQVDLNTTNLRLDSNLAF